MPRLWLLVAACCACSSAATGPRVLAILGVEPSCPVAGGTIALTLAGGDARSCDAGRIYVAGHELTNLGVVTTAPLVLAARLPAGFAPPQGAELAVTCGNQTARLPWFGVCGPEGGPPDAAPDRAPAADVAGFCGQAIELILDAVDKHGRLFPRDPEGVFLVPIGADDFAFDTGRSRFVSARDVTYTFSSDCFPRATVSAPVLGGFSTRGLSIDRRCQFIVEVVDLGCPEARASRTESTLRIVPAP